MEVTACSEDGFCFSSHLQVLGTRDIATFVSKQLFCRLLDFQHPLSIELHCIDRKNHVRQERIQTSERGNSWEQSDVGTFKVPDLRLSQIDIWWFSSKGLSLTIIIVHHI